jgi:hypothetical protein
MKLTVNEMVADKKLVQRGAGAHTDGIGPHPSGRKASPFDAVAGVER